MALGALALLPVANTAIAACQAPQACIACHTAPATDIPPDQATLEAMAPATCEVGDFSRGRNMTSPRFIHRTAKLHDGRVLLTGGQIQNSPSSIVTNSVEVFNPADNAVSPAHPMTVARWSHAAITLHDGRVLVTGGRTASAAPPGVVLATAEIYDPLTDTWTETAGAMNNARRSHAMSVLPDGRVLVSGGGGGVATASSPAIQTAEIFDPATGMFTLVAPMIEKRSAHSSTLLADGRVLVTGGSAGNGTLYPTKSAEIYDPATDTWTNVGPMFFSHLAQNPGQLRDGRLVQPSSYYNDTHTSAGGRITDESEMYTPSPGGNGAWTVIDPMFKQRIDIGAMPLLDGTLLVAGGVTTSPSYPSIFQSSSEVFDPSLGSNGQWKLSGIMSSGRDEFSGVLLDDGRAMISGGFVSPGAVLLNSIEIYTPGLKPQIKGYLNLLNDLPLSVYRLGPTSRLQMITRINAIGYQVGYTGTTVNLPKALTLASQLSAAVDSNLKPAATAEKARLKAVNQVLVNTLNDKISPNQLPTVAPSASPTSGVEQLLVNFTANAIDGDGFITNVSWNFGDFSYSTDLNPTHTYQCDGTYKVTVDVVDSRGAVASGTTTVTVTSAGGPTTYNCDVQPVFNRVCTGCHGSARGLSLTTCENLQLGSNPKPNRKVVIPGDSANSILIQRINSVATPMPPIGGLIPVAERNAIAAWIDALNPIDPDYCD